MRCPRRPNLASITKGRVRGVENISSPLTRCFAPPSPFGRGIRSNIDRRSGIARAVHSRISKSRKAEKVYITNVVKHFKWEERGKRRLHNGSRSRTQEYRQFLRDLFAMQNALSK